MTTPSTDSGSSLPRPAPGRSRARLILRRAAFGFGIIAALAILGALGFVAWFRMQLAASLPRVDGEIPLAGLEAPVVIASDALGVPDVRAESRADAAFATGFLHAQNRFFQMDLLRRESAGELAEVLGPALLDRDRGVRLHRFRSVAERVVSRAPAEVRKVLDAYVAGVNAGLATLGAKPFEYILLRTEPAAWRAEDSVLVLLTMFIELQDDTGRHEAALGLMHDVLPEPLYDFLVPRGTEWDAPIVGGPVGDPLMPGPDVFDLSSAESGAVGRLGPRPASFAMPPGGRRRVDPAGTRTAAGASFVDRDFPGSNNWAVAGRFTAHGGAILANDMHLGLSVPNTWYHVSLSWHAAGDPPAAHRITGVTLPGAPAIAAGSNGHIAWGFTNSYGDWSDNVLLEIDPSDPNRYMTPEGSKAIEHHEERIRVAGADDTILDVPTTIWGPILGKDHRGRDMALRWTAHDPEAVNFGLLDMETARDLDEALDVARRCGVPAQNAVIADASGRIAWTIMGAIPRREGFDGTLPGSWADGARRWNGWVAPNDHPRVVDPPSGRIWTANARVVDGEMLARVGDGGYDLGARARQIRDDLMPIPSASERDMLGVQLDDRALFLERWRELILRTLTPEAVKADPRRAELRRFVETTWTGKASVDSIGYRMVRGVRSFAAEQIFGPLTAACLKKDPKFSFAGSSQMEGPLWRLVAERPEHLLDPNHRTWDDQILAAVDAVLDWYAKDSAPLDQQTWGRRNTVRIQHPLSLALPFAGRWLDMPADPLPGDLNMPRVQGTRFGASERMVVSPGHEDQGIFHMPCGQSGHPLSPHYRDGHAAWARGEPAPFLPGPAVHTLTIRPTL